ncbi:RraA family protein [Sunxiuqinia elliptica]|uniref:Putative 4-hydroxy-4-methyl-2-oxoglutarate aldolase n=1 Tax=Sunxiuqinia elliptica TaxID=655355 RepID=A0A4R6HCH1_9BACT|nr:RraA family protein [Sunxiuqinia elliptica]TDO05476.1 regulator of RNase E activity RraA [Sunxiuqinia elliptica]TDO65022.1 regulator of RNase E activity RraA [Sunxiuqinia elliptica]
MAIWKDDSELFSIAKKELFVALVGDILDKLNFKHQFLSPGIKPLRDDFVVIGRAMPVLEADVFEEIVSVTKNPMMQKPFGLMFEALDSLQTNEVYICTGASPRYALWGGLMSTRAIKLGAAGAVLHGYSRDTNEILELNFPTFSYGGYAQDQGPRGKVVDYRVPIELEGIKVTPGDIIYGDRDGVLVVSQEVAEEAFSGAIEKARGEQVVKKALQEGMSTVEAFRKYGIM